MFKVGEYLVYKRDVCLVKDIKEDTLNNTSYYVLTPVSDLTLTISIPIGNKDDQIRNLITKEEIELLIKKIPNVDVIEFDVKTIEKEYKTLLYNGEYLDLIKIIKTAYLRNQNKLENKKKLGDRERHYFENAEICLYTELGIVLGLSLDETRKYIIEKL